MAKRKSPVRKRKCPFGKSPNKKISPRIKAKYEDECKDKLTERQKKYCSCVLKATGNRLRGNKKIDRNERNIIYGSCAKTTKGSNRECGKCFNFRKMNNETLEAFLVSRGQSIYGRGKRKLDRCELFARLRKYRAKYA